MITKNNDIELVVEGQELDISNSINLRLNDVLYNPLTVSNNQSSYSFSFDLPATAKNCKVLGYANVLEAPAKFSQRYNVTVYASSNILFEGTMIVNSLKEGKFNCNLVSVQVLSLEDIFGDMKMSDINWSVPFDGIPTINDVNNYASGDTKYWFPLACYGAFQKDPYHSDDYASDYTSKFVFDKWNRWHYSQFYPSVNVSELIKKAFRQKGYDVVGDAYSDDVFTSVYLTPNLADEQVPVYNLGNPLFGEANINFAWSNRDQNNGKIDGGVSDLTFKYLPTGFPGSSSSWPVAYTRSSKTMGYDYCNLTEVEWWDMLGSEMGGGGTEVNKSYLYDNGESALIIPADGYYQITLSFDGQLLAGDGGIQADTWSFKTNGEAIQGIPTTPVPLDASLSAPLEIQLVRNFDEDDPQLELIYGKNKTIYWANGEGAGPSGETITTCFPHESLAQQYPCPCSNQAALERTDQYLYRGGSRSGDGGGGSFGGNKIQRRGHSGGGDGSRTGTTGGDSGGNDNGGSGRRPHSASTRELGYLYQDKLMAYDPAVNANFLLGFSTLQGGVAAVIKDGKSWSRVYPASSDSYYTMSGYTHEYVDSAGTSISESSTVNKNFLSGCPIGNCSASASAATGQVQGIFYFYRNDIISLKAVQRLYTNYSYTQSEVGQCNYYWSVTGNLKIKAMADMTRASFKSLPPVYNMQSLFPYNLQLGNFLNSGETVASFVSDVQKVFSLQILQGQKEVTINTRTEKPSRSNGFVNLNDRVSADLVYSNDMEVNKLNLPATFAVQWALDEKEFGFVQSCPVEYQEEENWKDYCNSGYTTIKLDNDSYNTDYKTVNTNFSYNWYYPFTWWYTTSGGTDDSGITKTYDLPVIIQDEYMIENYKDDEAMQHDGFSLKKRLWFRNAPTDNNVLWSASTPIEPIKIAVPTNNMAWTNPFTQEEETIDLSYRLDEPTLLQRYYDVEDLTTAADELEINVYITEQEYKMIRSNVLVKINDDLYRTLEIKGFDPLGKNKTTLHLMKV